MTMVISFLSSVKSCGGGPGISSREEEVCPSSLEKERSTTMAILLLYSVRSCGGGHSIYSREEEVCSPYSQKEEKVDHGHLPPFLNGEVWEWPWPMPSSSREKEVCPSSPKEEIPTPREEKRLTMAISLISSVKSCEGGHGLRHHLLDGHLLPFLSRKLWRWSWHHPLEKRRSALLVLRRKGE